MKSDPFLTQNLMTQMIKGRLVTLSTLGGA